MHKDISVLERNQLLLFEKAYHIILFSLTKPKEGWFIQ